VRVRRLRRRRLPPPVGEVLRAAAGERLLAWAVAADGAHLVATDRSLHLPVRGRVHRIGWEQVDTATWDQDAATLTVVQAAERGGRPRRWPARLVEPRDLVDVVRERVNATVVWSSRVQLDGPAGARIVARRPPGSDVLRWSVALDDGLDAADPATRAMLDAAVRAARAELGP
jgi:hypothetical protein